MRRPFAFSAAVKNAAYLRQLGHCAVCNEDLADVIDHAHHVIPNQSGTPGAAVHAFLATAENCVIICDMCHGRVHQNENFRSGAVAPPDYFSYSHAHDVPAHRAWVRRLSTAARTVWAV
jgi:hypothetical protein